MNVVSDMSLTANFAINTYTVRFEVSEYGTLTDGTTTNDVLEYIVTHGSGCTEVTAIPDEGYMFKAWSGDFEGTDNSIAIEAVTENLLISADFAVKTEAPDKNGGGGGGRCFISSFSE